ncbi:MAG: N-acetylmuramoyl-L-alanine amidase [Treponema sp. CETP13]|nr:MAG: N-acetylmuramoyl-L-alanine amidase [Treponema sp. CETP13]
MKNKKLIFLIPILVITSIIEAENTSLSEMISLSEIAKITGSTLYWDGMSSNGILEKNGHHVSFSAYSNLVLLDYSEIKVCNTLTNKNGSIYADSNFLTTLQDLFNSIPPESKYRIGAILIDPGHGGKDPGAMSTQVINGKKQTIREKDLTLTVGKDLYTMLLRTFPDKKVLLTRDDDYFLSLAQRTDKANSVVLQENEAILFVSVHANSAFDTTANGYEVWYLSPGYRRNVLTDSSADKELQPILNSMMEEEFTTESILIAKYIDDGLAKEIGSFSLSRGIKEEEWFVCKNAKMPSVLVEMGFISNTQEAAYLIDKNYLHKVALGIYNGLVSFVKHFETSKGFTGIP